MALRQANFGQFQSGTKEEAAISKSTPSYQHFGIFVGKMQGFGKACQP